MSRGSHHIILLLLCGERKRQNPSVKRYWEIVADNLSKAGWSGDASQLWILVGEQALHHIGGLAERATKQPFKAKVGSVSVEFKEAVHRQEPEDP